jgi:flagellar protein FlaI
MLKEFAPNYTIEPQFGFYPIKSEKDWILKIQCTKCEIVLDPPNSRYKNNQYCLECVIGAISENLKKRIKKIEFDAHYYVPIEDIKNLQSLASFFSDYQALSIPECKIDFCCFSQSIRFSQFLKQWTIFLHTGKRIICSACQKKYRNLVKSLKKSPIFNEILKTPTEENWPSMLFIGPYSRIIHHGFTQCPLKKELLGSYRLSNFPLYRILVYDSAQYENFLEIKTEFGTKSGDFYLAILSNLQIQVGPPKFDHLLPIGVVLRKYIEHVTNYLNINYQNLDSEEISKIALYYSTSKLNIAKLFPLLVDDRIDEIYLDNPERTIYIDHRDFGRCNTSLLLSINDISSIQTFLRVSSNKKLDPNHPSLKTSIYTEFFFCRFAIDISPIVSSGFSLDIRKMNRKIFTIPELIQRGMLSNQIAAFLFICVINRLNITAIGETNTGKTTLINALDLLAPSHYRKIYIEESPESLDQNFSFNHQLKYQVEPASYTSSKIQEMYRLLHRNPDLVYLGEILTKEEAHAMFHCLSAGLRGFQTIHARDIDSLINRWRYHFKIDPSCYNDLDIIILLKRTGNLRYIALVAELRFSEENLSIHSIFRFNPETSDWNGSPNFDQIHCFTRLLPSKDTIAQHFESLAFFSGVFSNLTEKCEWNVENQVKLFQNLYNHIERLKKTQKKINWNKLNTTVEGE